MDVPTAFARGRSRPVRRPVSRSWPGALVVLAALLTVLVAPAVASAAAGILTVTVDGPGRVTAAGIDCPGDCAEGDAWPDDRPAPQRALTAAPAPGYRTEWTGCAVVAGRPNQCTATFDENGTEIVVRFVDVEPPTLAFAAPSPLDGALFGRNGVAPVYAVEAADNAGVVRVEFRDGDTLYDTVRAAPWKAGPRAVFGRADGPHVIRATAYDAAGNATSVERVFRYDGTSPEILLSGGSVRFTRETTTRIDWTATDADLKPLDQQRCGYLLRPATTFIRTSCVQPLTITHATEGVWEAWIWVQDGAGNATQQFVTINVDRTAPAVPLIDGGIPDGGVSGTRDSRVRMLAPVGEQAADLTWNCRANDVLVACPDGAASWTAPPGTTEVRFRASVSDRAGNESASVERRWTVDEAPPAVEFTAGPAEGAVVTEGDVTIAWRVPDRYGAQSRCDWQDEDVTPCAEHRLSRRVTPGTYRLRVIVADDRGLETTVVRSFTVVSAPPGGDPDPTPGPGPGSTPDPGPSPVPGPFPSPAPEPPAPAGGGPRPSGSGDTSSRRCVVPRIRRGATLEAARRQLTRAGCKVRAKRVRSAKVKRGRVVKLSAKAGTKRPHGSAVTVQVSRGRR